LHDLETKLKELEARLKESKAKFEAEAKTSKAETKEFKAKAKKSDESLSKSHLEVEKLQPAKNAFRDIRRDELRKLVQKSCHRLNQKRNEAAHGGNLLGDLYVIQEDLESDPNGGNVLKDGFNEMYKLRHEQIAPHISQTTQTPDVLNIGANVGTLDEIRKSNKGGGQMLDTRSQGPLE
jgi:hypothetical protein